MGVKIIVLVIGVVLLAIYLKKILYRKNNFIKIEGVCCKTEIKLIRTHSGWNRNYKSCSSFKYNYNGVDYIYSESSYNGSPKIKEGKIYPLYINKNDYRNCLTPAYDVEINYFKYLGIIALAYCLFGDL